MTQTAAGLTILSNEVTMGGRSVGAFGDLIAQPLDPLIQMDFVYGINVQTGLGTVLNSAVVDTNASRLRLQSGTNSAGSAVFNSRRSAKYRPGQGITARFTAAFTAGVASSSQKVGIGNTIDGYFFGFNGTAFGILHRNNSADTWIAQTTWNGDKCDGTGPTGFVLNPAFGNVYQVVYPYLGYGSIRFYVLAPGYGWLLVHTILYPNTTTATQLTNGNMGFYAQSLNAGATSNQIIYVGSVGVFLNGERSFIGSPKWAADTSKAAVTTEAVLMNIRNATTYNGVTNRSLMRLNMISASTNANAIGTIRLRAAITLGGSPSFTQVNGTSGDGGVTVTSGNSVAATDTAGTQSAGIYIFNFTIANLGYNSIDLTPFEIFIAPGEVMSITGQSSASATLGLSINWSEDQ